MTSTDSSTAAPARSTLAQPPDYRDTLRAEIVRTVERLKHRLETAPDLPADTDLDGPVTVTSLELGYLVNSHRGLALFEPGECIADLPVTICYYRPRVVELHAKDVSTVRITEEEDDDGEWHEVEDYGTEDLSVREQL